VGTGSTTYTIRNAGTLNTSNSVAFSNKSENLLEKACTAKWIF
jgi:hypothetical protein